MRNSFADNKICRLIPLRCRGQGAIPLRCRGHGAIPLRKATPQCSVRDGPLSIRIEDAMRKFTKDCSESKISIVNWRPHSRLIRCEQDT